MRATCTDHLILLDFITRTIMGEEYRSLSPSSSFLHFPVTSSLLSPNILLNTLFSNSLSSCSWFTGCKHKHDKLNRHSVRQRCSRRCHSKRTVPYMSVLNPKNHKLINACELLQTAHTCHVNKCKLHSQLNLNQFLRQRNLMGIRTETEFGILGLPNTEESTDP